MCTREKEKICAYERERKIIEIMKKIGYGRENPVHEKRKGLDREI